MKLSQPVRGFRGTGRTRSRWLAMVVAAVVAALLIRLFVFQSYAIPSGSMSPTLRVGDRVYVDKLSYHLHSVHRGDVVVFRTPPGYVANPHVSDLIKRVIGLPGETIGAKAGTVYINGSPLREKWLSPDTTTADFGPIVVPPGSYFVMGDNRSDSSDSRVFGPIPARLIVGHAFVVVWPVSRIGGL